MVWFLEPKSIKFSSTIFIGHHAFSKHNHQWKYRINCKSTTKLRQRQQASIFSAISDRGPRQSEKKNKINLLGKKKL